MLSPTDLRCDFRRDPLGVDSESPRLSWTSTTRERGQEQTAYQIQVAADREALVRNPDCLWDSGKVAARNTLAAHYRGLPLAPARSYYWRVRVWDKEDRASRWSAPAAWETGLPTAEDWGQAVWINDGKQNPAKSEEFYGDDPAPLLRSPIFECPKPVVRARLYISGLGYFEPFVNDVRVGDSWLNPGWTTVEKRVQYCVFDVTDTVKIGKNRVGAILGNGFYNPLPLPFFGKFNLREYLSVGRPRLIARLEIHHPDDTKTVVVTDDRWEVTDGPIVRNSVYLGERYDARREVPHWFAAAPSDASWHHAGRAPETVGPLTVQTQPPVRITGKLKPQTIKSVRSGVVIVDFGQNFAGVVSLRVQGAAPGTEITLRSGELLYSDGTLNPMTAVAGQIKNPKQDYGGAPIPAIQADTYICKGGNAVEEWSPRFTFHGFRYVEITGWPGTPARDDIDGLRLSADLETIGSFSCSDRFLNKLDSVCRWTFLSNVFSIQSDCPQREKFGYGGDIVPSADAFYTRFDMAAFYSKVADDLADAARPNGGIPETAPYVGIADNGPGGGAGPMGWMVALPVLLDTLYRYSGDQTVIERHYEAVARLVRFSDRMSDGHIVPFCIGDHESIDPKQPALFATAFHCHQARLASRFARILSRNSDATEFDALAEAIRAAFIKRFLKPGTGVFDIGTQACQATAFAYDLVPPEEWDAARKRLIDAVKVDHDGHSAAGIFGARFLLDSLSRLGEDETAYGVATIPGFPGWRHMLDSGATTLWEHWKFSDNTFSHNHPMFGSVSAWMTESVAGLRPAVDAVGFDRVDIRPGDIAGLRWARARYRSVRGLLSVEWRRDNGQFHLDVRLPVGVSGTVWLPASNPIGVTESGKATVALGMENGRARYEIGSGRWQFVSSLPPAAT